MPGPRPWIGRSFSFGFDAELFPNLLARLRGTPARLEELLRGAPADALRRKPGGKWSAKEHAGHLHELDALGLLRVRELLAGEPVLTAADMTNAATEQAGFDGRDTEDVLAAFRARRAELLQLLEPLGPEDHVRSARHERLGRDLRLVDLLHFHAEHDDHHLAHVHELLHGA